MIVSFKGYEPKKGVFIDFKKMNREVDEILAELNCNFKSSDLVSTLTAGEMQMLAIARALYHHSTIISLDEPTASITMKETEALFDVVRKLKKQGVTILYVSHRLEEIFQICDRASILRDGEYIQTMDIKNTTREELIHAMVGRDVAAVASRTKPSPRTDEVVLSVEHLTNENYQDVSFELHKGEILGFGGLSESGMHEIGKAIFGASYDRTGSVTLADGTQINDIPTAIKHSIAYTSKDRDNESVVLNQSIGDNICLPSLDELAGKSHLLSDKKRKEFADKYAKQMSVKMVDVNQFVSNLSGGNKQKVVLARWIGKDSDIVVLDSPTRGIDIKVKQDIYQLMNQMRKNGKSIIMISEELMELIGMCDRIVIMKDGKISGQLDRDKNLDENGLISMMV